MIQDHDTLQKHEDKDIEVDGGLKPATIDIAAKAGANMIVSGSGIFKADDMAFNVSTMRRSLEKYCNGWEDNKLSPIKYSSKNNL